MIEQGQCHACFGQLQGCANVFMGYECDAGMTSLGPAVQYLAGEMLVDQGSVMPLLASHNTVRMRFDIEQAEYLHLAKPDATFPAMHFSMLADQSRNHVRLSHVETT